MCNYSKVIASYSWPLWCCQHKSNNLDEMVHHFNEMSPKGFLKKPLNKISYSVISFFLIHRGNFGPPRVVLLKLNEFKTELFIFQPRQGHAWRNKKQIKIILIPLIHISVRTKSKKIYRTTYRDIVQLTQWYRKQK